MVRLCLMLAGLVLLTAVVYWPVRNFGLVDYDDLVYLQRDPHIAQGLSWAGTKDAFFNLRQETFDPPLVALSFELDASLWKLRPGPMHVENVLLHLISGLLLWRLLLVLTGQMNWSWFAAAIFLCHPLHVESVAWIAERKDVLSLPFLLGAMLFYVAFCRNLSHGKRWWIYLGMLLLFVVSLIAKGMGVTFPALLLLLDFWPLQRWPGLSWLKLVIEKLPVMIISVLASVYQSITQQQIGAVASSTLSLFDRGSNAIVCYVLYMLKLLVPTDLAVFYPHPLHRPAAALFAAAGLLLFITWLSWQQRQRRPFLIVGWLWFLGTLVPVIGLVQIGQQAMADRYSYLPSIGFELAIIWTLAPFFRPAFIRPILAIVLIAIFSVMAHTQVLYWHDTATLFAHAADVTEENHVAYVELASIAFKRGEVETAKHLYRMAKTNARAYAGLGDCYLPTDRTTAISYYRQAVAARPQSAFFLYELAHALRLDGQNDEARQLLNKALELDPNPVCRDELMQIDQKKNAAK